jgi:hypothetical protein
MRVALKRKDEAVRAHNNAGFLEQQKLIASALQRQVMPLAPFEQVNGITFAPPTYSERKAALTEAVEIYLAQDPPT